MNGIIYLFLGSLAVFGAINGIILLGQMMTGTGNRRQRIRSLGTCICMLLYGPFMLLGLPAWGSLMAVITLILNLTTLISPGPPVKARGIATIDPPSASTGPGDALDGIREIAATGNPDLAEPLTIAVSRIGSFRLIPGDDSDPEAATVATMIEHRIPSLLNAYRSNHYAANPEERRMMATTVIEAVIDIGEAAERHRAAAIARRQDSMTAEARFISERLGSDEAHPILGRP